MACAVWMRRRGCDFRALKKRRVLPAELSDGPSRSIQRFRDTRRDLTERGAAMLRPYKNKKHDWRRRLCKETKLNFCRSRREVLAEKQEVSCWKWAWS